MRIEWTEPGERVSGSMGGDVLHRIVEVVRRYPEGATIRDIEDALQVSLPRRTLQARLRDLVDEGRLQKVGERRWTRYLAPVSPCRGAGKGEGTVSGSDEIVPLSPPSETIRAYLRRSPELRIPVGYDRDLLDSYQPGSTWYLSEDERTRLAMIGTRNIGDQPAGTYARRILDRLLIDLSWNSSRLEGNTYSLLDTRRLLEFGEEAEGRDHLEAQMILNHKDAIEFLVSDVEAIGFNRYTILNLHAMLANNLLPDETAAGRLRYIAVGIEQSPFHPLEVPQLIEECFDLVLAKATAIDDPFEQAFFFMVHLPYLQPFDDVNKRVSRIGANIPLVKRNLVPLSFVDVPRATYSEAVLGIYEMNRISLLKDVFLWAYERSAVRYSAARQSLGEPDPFRLRYRDALRALVGDIVRQRLGRREAAARIADFAGGVVDKSDRQRFREVAESEVLALHEGNFARYRISPSEFEAWRARWSNDEGDTTA